MGCIIALIPMITTYFICLFTDERTLRDHIENNMFWTGLPIFLKPEYLNG